MADLDGNPCTTQNFLNFLQYFFLGGGIYMFEPQLLPHQNSELFTQNFSILCGLQIWLHQIIHPSPFQKFIGTRRPSDVLYPRVNVSLTHYISRMMLTILTAKFECFPENLCIPYWPSHFLLRGLYIVTCASFEVFFGSEVNPFGPNKSQLSSF